MNNLLQEFRFSLRQLRKTPVFTLTAVLTLALGIGATATMYSVVHDVLLAPIPFPDRDRLVGVAFAFPQEEPNNGQAGTSADFVRQHSRSFESVGLADDSGRGANLSGTEDVSHSSRVTSTMVSQDYFPTLGVKPFLGRDFTPEEDLPNGPKVVLLSYRVWQHMFAADPTILNRAVRMNEESYTVVGVMPEGITGSASSQHEAAGAGIWLPMQLSPRDPGYEGDNYIMVARLRSGVTVAQAQQEMDLLKAPFYAQFPGYKSWTGQGKLLHEFRVWPLQAVLVSGVRKSLLILLAAVSAVLLVACFNLAGLMTARVSKRQRELAVRTALGATRRGILRLLACESVVLAVGGAGIGLLLAGVARPALLAVSPLAIPLFHTHEDHAGVAAFVVLLTLLATLLCGLLPAWTVLRHNAQQALAGGQALGAGSSQVRTGKTLLVAQIAVAMVLLSASSLLLNSFLKLRSIPSGVEAKRLAVAQVSLKGSKYETALHTAQFVEKVQAELQTYPGVQQVAAVNGLPLDGGLNIGGSPADRPQLKQTIEFRSVTPGYFRTLGISVLRGRDIDADDRAASDQVALISEAAARKWWPDRSPIGERIVSGGGPRTIVGVVSDIHSHSLAEKPHVMIYAPFAQISDNLNKAVNGWFATSFAIRMSGDLDLARAVQKAVSDADPEIPVAKLTTMQAVIDDTVASPRFFSWMTGGFASFALLLTAIGLFGLMSYQVTQRTKEIGVRLAIGSSRRQILLLILGRGLMLASFGLALGGAASLVVPKLVASLVESNVSAAATTGSMLARDLAAFVTAALAMLAAAIFASYLPARRAAAVEPMQALRAE